VAIIGVLMLHSTIWGAMPSYLPGGNLGVAVFFVLSGYLITTLLLREHERTGTIDVRSFYLRRAARLLPGLLVLLPIYVLVFSRDQSAWQLVLLVGPVLLYLSSFVQAIWGAMGPLAWTWSLSVEEHFYACWPFAMRWLLGGRAARRRGVRGWIGRHPLLVAGAAAAVVIAVATGTRIYLAGSFRWDEFAYYATPTRMDGLAVGCLAALLGHRYRRPLPWVAGWGALVAIAWCYVNPEFTIGTDALNLYGLPLSELAAAVLIVSVVNRPRGLLARALSFPPLVHLGVISYGLYLWNLLPGQTWTLLLGRHAGIRGTVVLFAVMFVAVELSYRYVERPVMRWAKARMAGPKAVSRRRYRPRTLPELAGKWEG
jgi:peptidoglycan/LPS O-acetylase OafA/YrhL